LALRAQGSRIGGNRIIDFVVNGRHLSEASFVLPAAASSGFNTLLLNMAMFGPGEKTVEVHVQDAMPYSGVFEIGLEQDAAVWPKENPNRFKLTLEGDSICRGSFFTGSKPRFRLERLIADMLGTDHHYNNAVGGTGAISTSGSNTTYIQRLADVVEFGSDVHIIAGFHNDVGNDETENSTTRQAAFLEYLQACRAQLPNATLVVLGALPLRGDTITEGETSLHQVEVDAKAAFDAFNDPNSLFIPIFTEARPRITSTAVGRYFMNATSPYNDGHPTPLFYPAIAALIAEKIKAFFAD
jgi:lysophospholipase L1-like esterase